MLQRQRGMTMIGLILIAILVVFFGLITIKIVPTVIEYQSISKAVNKAGNEGNSVLDVRNIYTRATEVEQIISSISAQDLDIKPDGQGGFTVQFAYNKEIPLIANAYILIKYEGSNKKTSQSDRTARGI